MLEVGTPKTGQYPLTENPGSSTVMIDGFWMDLTIHGIYVLKSRISIYMNPYGFVINSCGFCIEILDFTMKLRNVCEFVIHLCGFYYETDKSM